jgi:hypothetical protein
LDITDNPNNPNWEPVTYPNNTATLYGAVSINGYDAESGDVVAAFAGDECRGTADIQMVFRSAFVTIDIEVAENGEAVVFKVYDISEDEVLEADYTTEVDIAETIGSYPDDLQPIDAFGVLAIPQNVTIIATSNSAVVEVQLAWEAVSGATSYTVYRTNDAYADFPASWTAVTGISETSWHYTTDRTKRFYRVTANN